MTADATLAIVRSYHQSWTTRNFVQASDLLSPALSVEVPINEYPGKESFAQALAAFGSTVESVDLLSEMVAGNEAMLLYDMQVDRLGTLRVVEHFTVAGGQIVRLRQIHDTAPIREAGFGPSNG